MFDVSRRGVLSPAFNAPFANGQSGTCCTEITQDGKYLFAVNTGATTIDRYSVAADGGLTLLGNTPLTNPGPGGLRPFDARLTPNGNFLYVVDPSGRISAFSVSGGDLTELPSSPVPLPAGLTPFGIVANLAVAVRAGQMRDAGHRVGPRRASPARHTRTGGWPRRASDRVQFVKNVSDS